MLERLAAGASDLTEDEQAVADAFGAEASPARFRQAHDGVRFQLGQADRFREGLLRSGTWEGHIAEVFAERGLPPELAALPHVESSFDPTAYSKVGAAGLWQFMPATGRRYLRIDDAVDERLDPFRATEAAAQLLDFNYRFLGSWPLALTAYNHGAARHAPRTRCHGHHRHRHHRAHPQQPQLRLRLAQFLRLVPGRARDRPQSREIFRQHRAPSRDALLRSRHAGLCAARVAGKDAESGSRAPRLDEPRAASAGVGRAETGAKGLQASSAGRIPQLDVRAARAAAGSARAVCRPDPRPQLQGEVR